MRPTAPSGSGLAALGFYLFVVALNLLQAPGRTTYDARVELTEQPRAFLAQAFTLWHPESNFGEFQNQGYGYLVPQGAWFVLLELLGVPDWVSQRLWSALVVIVACEGARRVARAAGLDGAAALVAGVVFACSPRLLGTVGVISSETLPGAMTPWVVLPVLLALRGRLPGWTAATLSGAAVVCMGGVNAVENAGALPLAAVLVLWGVGRRLVPWRFAGQWALMVGLASAWWALPLLLLARYSPPFYEYVESAANTTGVVGWSEASRGDSHWVGYLVTGDRAIWPAAHFLVSDPLMIVVAAIVTAIGLVGLAAWRDDLRTPLVGTAVLGLGLMTVAHGGWAASPLAAGARDALDGALQIFRNVHKLDPSVRLPVALGFGHAAALAVGWLVERRPRLAESRGGLLAVPACLALVLGQPFLDNNVRTPGWDEVPDAWVQARDYLADHQDGTTALVVPGTGFARQDWGWTNDEPLLALGGVSWVSRSQVPLVPGQSLRFLSGLDSLVTTGRAPRGLADQLARAGIGHVVVRRDLVRGYTASPHPGVASISLDQDGLRPVAAYGSERDGGPRIEIVEVDSYVPPVRSTQTSDAITVAGVPESILDVGDAGLVRPEQATVLAGEDGWDAPPDVVTDGNQRRERAFGSVTESLSAVMEAGEGYRVPRAAHDYPGVDGAAQVVARYDGVGSIRASSSQGYADTFGAVAPQNGPASAFDANPGTRWVSSPAGVAREQWLRLEYDEPRRVDEVRLAPVVNDPALVPIRELEVEVGGVTRRLRANPTGSELVAEFGGRTTRTVEVRVTGVGSAAARGAVAIREVMVDDEAPARTLVLPDEVAADSALLVETDPSLRACSPTGGLPDCSVSRIRGSEEPGGMDRTFTTPDGLTARVEGLVVARGTAATGFLLAPLGDRLQVGSTSVYGSDPRVSARFAHDGDPGTVWLSDDLDPTPTLLLRWKQPQRITGITLDLGGQAGELPLRTTVRAGGRTQDVRVTGGRVDLDPVRTRTLEIAFRKARPGGHVMVRELELAGTDVTAPFDPDAPTGAVCGLGPNLEVGGRQLSTRVSGTMGDLVTGRPLRFEACDEADPDGEVAEVELGPGQHRLRTPPSEEFQVVRLVATPASYAGAREAAAYRDVDVRRWDATERSLRVGPGGDTVLAVPENFNPGWVARLGDRELDPIRVDGWQQGWVLPEGEAVTVRLDYAPQGPYRGVLVVGLTLAAGLLVAALALLLRRRPVTAGVEAADDAWPTPVPWRPAVAVAMTVGAVLLLGWVAAVGLALALALPRQRARLLALAALLVVGAAAVDAWQEVAWQRSAADAGAALAVGMLAGLVPAEGARRSRAGGRSPVGDRTGGGVWRGPQAWAALGVLASTAVWRAVLLQDSFFNQDDYYLTARGLDRELTWSLLFEPVAGHVMPAQQLSYWFVANSLPFDWSAVAAAILVAHLLAGVLMWHLLTRLLPGRWARVPLLAAFVWSPLTLVTSLWWSAAMGLWPHVLLSLLAMLLMVRAIQGAGHRWVNLAGCVLASAAGLLWHERAVLIPPVLFGLAVVLSEAAGWRRVVDALRRWWPLWATYAGLLVGYLVAHAQITSVEGAQASWRTRLAISWAYVAENVLPGLASGPWSAELEGGAVVPPLWVTVLSLILAAALVVLLVRRGGRDARWALALLAAYVLVDLALLLSGRGGFGRVIGLDPRYSSDIVHLAVPCLALALRGAPARFGLPADVPGGWPRVRTVALGGLTAAYLVGSAFGTAVLVPHFQNPEDREYVANLRDGLARDPSVVLLDEPVPDGIVLPLVGEESLLSRVFEPLPEQPQFDLPSERLRVVDRRGRLSEPVLALPAVMERGPVAGCGYAVRRSPVTIELDRTVEARAVLRVEYFTGDDAEVGVRVGEWTAQFHADTGPNIVWLVVPGQPQGLGSVEVRVLDDPDATVCVAGLQAGWPERP